MISPLLCIKIFSNHKFVSALSLHNFIFLFNFKSDSWAGPNLLGQNLLLKRTFSSIWPRIKPQVVHCSSLKRFTVQASSVSLFKLRLKLRLNHSDSMKNHSGFVFHLVKDFVDFVTTIVIYAEGKNQIKKIDDLEAKYKEQRRVLQIVEKKFNDLKESNSHMESEIILVKGRITKLEEDFEAMKQPPKAGLMNRLARFIYG
jgi:hypothetical protein